jgi:D-glycero-alpha-D-manno-heptose-7-phosphate kinase
VVETASQLKHSLVREALAITELDRALEITTIGDVPAGTGMGSSSSLAVGLLTALYAYQGRTQSAEILASQACEIEIERLGNPIGKQDQYAAAYGGLQYIRFNPDGSVHVEPVPGDASMLNALADHMLLFYTGGTRSASALLEEQARETPKKIDSLRRMRDIAGELRETLTTGAAPRFDVFGDKMHEAWELKRSVTDSISNPMIDDWYARGRAAGAYGGKLLGAGGGGFLLLFAPPDRHGAIREALGQPKEMAARLDPRGSRIIFIGARR